MNSRIINRIVNTLKKEAAQDHLIGEVVRGANGSESFLEVLHRGIRLDIDSDTQETNPLKVGMRVSFRAKSFGGPTLIACSVKKTRTIRRVVK